MPIGRVIRHGDVEQERLLKRFLGQNLRKILYIDRVIGEGEVKLFQHVVFFLKAFHSKSSIRLHLFFFHRLFKEIL